MNAETDSNDAPRDAGDHRAVVELLSSRAAYSDAPARVDVFETHISVVFVTDHFAYKLKKPVRYDFLDYSTLEARRRACDDEVRLNKRLAEGIYLGVLPITAEDDGRLRLAGTGRPVEWVVHMRRLDTDRSLDALLRRGALGSAQIEQLASTLAEFYTAAAPLTLSRDEYAARIEAHIRGNRAELTMADGEHPPPLVAHDHAAQHAAVRKFLSVAATLVKRVHAAQLAFVLFNDALLAERVRDGRIVEAHGDLRPEHVCFNGRPAIFDCIEFSADFRRLDVADELSFLAVECELLGAPAVGEQVFEAYCHASGDRPSADLVAFYKSYRACVRAKVAVLRARQQSNAPRSESLDLAARYLDLADRYAARFARPVLIVMSGLMGSGKSTLAAAVSERLGAERFETDAVRRELFGASAAPTAFGQGNYKPEKRDQVYHVLLERAREALASRLPIVLDGAFLRAEQRTAALALARADARTVALVVHCQCAADVAKRRIAERQARGDGPSEARVELYDQQRGELEGDPSGTPAVTIDTTRPLAEQVDQVIARLRTELGAAV